MNDVRLGQDDVIYQEYVGTQTAESVKQTVEKTTAIVVSLRQQQKRVNVLVDISHIGSIDTEVRLAAFEGIGKLDMDKLAIIGATLFLRHVISLVLYSSPKKEKVRLFDTTDEAMRWLTHI